jgi:uncharacterized integral membrane protein
MAQQQGHTATTTSTTLYMKWVAAVVLFAIALTFIVQNRQRIDVYLFTTTVSSPAWVALAVILVFGMLIGFLMGIRSRGRSGTGRDGKHR